MKQRVASEISRRAAMMTAALSAVGLLGSGAAASTRASAAPGDVATERKQPRKVKPTTWKANFDNTRIERHPNGRDGEYLAHLTGGSGSGRCRRTDKVRKIGHERLSRCVERDSRDLSDGHVGTWLGGKQYRLLGHSWDDSSGDLQMHLRADDSKALRDAGQPVAAETTSDSYGSAAACYCPEGFCETFPSGAVLGPDGAVVGYTFTSVCIPIF
jgi:hypothetical protein